MRIQPTRRLVVSLCVASFVIGTTGGLLTQRRSLADHRKSSKTAQRRVNAPAKYVEIDPKDMPKPQTREEGEAALKAAKIIASAGKWRLDIETKKGVCEVSAEVELYNRNPNRYCWVLMARNRKTGELVYDHIYNDRVFSIKLQSLTTENFEDSIPLLPGSYRFEIGLYCILDDTDPTQLGDPVLENRFRTLVSQKDVEVR